MYDVIIGYCIVLYFTFIRVLTEIAKVTQW